MVDISGTEADETLVGTALDDIIDGGDGNDSLNGGAGNDTLLGRSAEFGDYNDEPYADTLEGGTGNDLLRGGAGDDVYVFNLGDGHDTINDEYLYHFQNDLGGVFNPQYLDGGLDTLKFGPGISPSDILMTFDGEDLYVGIAEGSTDIFGLSNLIKIEKWQDSIYRVENIEFDDGTVWGDADIRARMMGTSGDDTLNWLPGSDAVTIDGLGGNDSISSTDGDDHLLGGTGSDTLHAGEGNNTLNGGAGNDTLSAGDGTDLLDGGSGDDDLDGGNGADLLLGGAGDDTLRGSDGVSDSTGTTNINETEDSDTLSGGLGNDLVRGGGGDDVYRFQRGDGADYVSDEYFQTTQTELGHIFPTVEMNGGALDIIEFGPGISSGDLWMTFVNDELLIGIRDGATDLFDLTDSITIEDWQDELNRVEEIHLDDGTVLDVIDIMSNISGSLGDDTITYTDEMDLIADGASGNDSIISGEGDDVINGGSGEDTIEAGWGQDTVYGDAGADQVNGSFGDDSIFGGDGNDTIDGGQHNDYLNGGAGNDLLEGSSGMTGILNEDAGLDTLEGGTGTDTLYGGGGNDVYVYSSGDGQDHIYDNYLLVAQSPLGHIFPPVAIDAGELDRFQMLDFSLSDATFSLVGINLYVGFGQAGEGDFDDFSDMVLLDDWLLGFNRIEEFEFGGDPSTAGDNTILTDQEIIDAANLTYVSTAGDDTINAGDIGFRFGGDAGNDLISGGNGADVIDGGTGNDTVLGGVSDDRLIGGSGDDVLSGEVGNDFLAGGAGSDTLHGGSGQDTFSGTASELDGDFVEGITNGDVIEVVGESFGGGDVTVQSGAYARAMGPLWARWRCRWSWRLRRRPPSSTRARVDSNRDGCAGRYPPNHPPTSSADNLPRKRNPREAWVGRPRRHIPHSGGSRQCPRHRLLLQAGQDPP